METTERTFLTIEMEIAKYTCPLANVKRLRRAEEEEKKISKRNIEISTPLDRFDYGI